MSPVFDIAHLTKRYPGQAHPANDDVSLQIPEGEIFGLLGPNGAGKTTLIRQMVGLLAPDSGRVLLLGQDIARAPGLVARTIAYLPQAPYALYDLTVAQAVYFAGHLRGLSRAAARATRDELLVAWDLQPLRDRVVRQISGGQRRLVGLAATLAGPRPVLILDEPTAGLDPVHQRQVWDWLLRCRGPDTTIILVTHDLNEAERLADRVGVMRAGRLYTIERPGRLTSDLVRLEWTFPPGSDGQQLLAGWGECRPCGHQRWAVTVPAAAVDQVLAQVVTAGGGWGQVEVRAGPPALEDVYLAVQTDPAR
ncbi:MAG: ABC transporter ATP-binding protein [Chloroflexi bacterium]|nr:ABC transporter ATP-binding protein [Chloroflexota bacterium]